MAGTTVPAMSRPKQFEEHRWLGDKRTQRVHDLDHATPACAIDELLSARVFPGTISRRDQPAFVCFGPDTLLEASNHQYRPCRHCVSADVA